MPSRNSSAGVLQRLHDSEINASIATFYDGGFTARLGDEMNGWDASEVLPSQAEAEAWLEAKAVELYPDSEFAKARP